MKKMKVYMPPSENDVDEADENAETAGSLPGALMEGLLKKQGSRLGMWKSRFYVLVPGKLVYYASQKDILKGSKGELSVTGDATFEESTKDMISFTLIPGQGPS